MMSWISLQAAEPSDPCGEGPQAGPGGLPGGDEGGVCAPPAASLQAAAPDPLISTSDSFKK